MQISFSPPPADCPRCPRLCAFREANRAAFPTYHNAPVPAFGGLDAEILVVGLAPGLHGANASGRPFTGDYAGFVMYPALLKHGLATGHYDAEAKTGEVPDDFNLIGVRITNAVRCVPPENKPTPEEIRTCNDFLRDEIAAMKNLKVILSLGTISHQAVLRAFGLKVSAAKFGHAAEYALPNGVTLLDSYHTSRYNINTGRLTVEMFDKIVARMAQLRG